MTWFLRCSFQNFLSKNFYHITADFITPGLLIYSASKPAPAVPWSSIFTYNNNLRLTLNRTQSRKRVSLYRFNVMLTWNVASLTLVAIKRYKLFCMALNSFIAKSNASSTSGSSVLLSCIPPTSASDPRQEEAKIAHKKTKNNAIFCFRPVRASIQPSHMTFVFWDRLTYIGPHGVLIKGPTIRKVMGGVGKKPKKYSCKGKCPKKNSCKGKCPEKKFMHKMGLILIWNHNSFCQSAQVVSLTRHANAPQLPGGGWAQLELTDALL